VMSDALNCNEDHKDVLVIASDLKVLQYCNRGARFWFSSHGLDWAHFKAHGYRVSEVMHINDGMMQAAIDTAVARTLKES